MEGYPNTGYGLSRLQFRRGGRYRHLGRPHALRPDGVRPDGPAIRAREPTVHAPESLGHPVERRQVAEHVAGRDVDTDLPGGTADEINRTRCWGNLPLLLFIVGIGRLQEPCEDGPAGFP